MQDILGDASESRELLRKEGDVNTQPESIYVTLEKDHRVILSLLRQLASADSSERPRLFRHLAAELRAHANAEEKSIYARLLIEPATHLMARQAFAEHKRMRRWIRHMARNPVNSRAWLDDLRHLHGLLHEHAIRAERELFVAAADQLSPELEPVIAAEFEKIRAPRRLHS